MNDLALIDAYELHQRRRCLSPNTIDRRGYGLHAFSAYLAGRGLRTATRQDVEAFLDGRAIGPNTRSWHLSNFACFYRWAVEEGYAPADPTARIQRPRVRRPLPRPMHDADLAMALELAGPRMRAWLCLAAYQGLRAAEIAALRREDVLDSATPPMLVVYKGKGDKARMLPLNRSVELALVAYGMPRTGWLWPGKHGGHLRPSTVTKYIARYLHDLGIAATAHQGRHWAATRWYAMTHDLRLVQELLGHESLTTTAQYTRVVPSAAASVVRDVDVANPLVV